MDIKVRVITDLEELEDCITELEDFDNLPIKPCWESGVFEPSRLYDLERFCKKYPEYHICSHVSPYVIFNWPVEKVIYYELATGSKERIIYVKPRTLWWYQLDLLYKFWTYEDRTQEQKIEDS